MAAPAFFAFAAALLLVPPPGATAPASSSSSTLAWGFSLRSPAPVRVRSVRRRSAAAGALASDVEAGIGSSSDSSSGRSSSLASSYALRIFPPTTFNDDGEGEARWELLPLSRWEDDGNSNGEREGEGAAAIRALEESALPPPKDGNEETEADCSLVCRWKAPPAGAGAGAGARAWSATIDVEGGRDVGRELTCVLSRVLVQSAARHIASLLENDAKPTTTLRVELPLPDGDGCQVLTLSDILPVDASVATPPSTVCYDDDDSAAAAADVHRGIRRLFAPLGSLSEGELVDAVDRRGIVLGSVPRPLVHRHNLLHRGAGIMVSRDVDVLDALDASRGTSEATSEAATPEVYVHRRADAKSIFPSLYDMFVGGVSLSGEGGRLTAAREVAEELGLHRGLDFLERGTNDNADRVDCDDDDDDDGNPLSEELFKCTVCTAYNRCVVSMFSYACDVSAESIAWQVEEVAWGSFVPYDVVASAAEASIGRMRTAGTWPGRGEDALEDEDEQGIGAIEGDDGGREELTWDFVPDGLLVWEGWRAFVARELSAGA
ncbi:hypothetical protein ACHAWF_009428 [Thalassiosira exigua]